MRMSRDRCKMIAWLAPLTVLLALLLTPSTAQAYPWMIRHGYTDCALCHVDPSGAGLLSQYGRAQSEILLRTRYKAATDEEPGSVSQFAWGAVTPPDWLNLGGSYRGAMIYTNPQSGSASARWVNMQADIKAQATAGRLRVNGSLGVEPSGASAAAVTKSTEGNLVSREHWIGFDLGEDREMLVRAGRINIPFGLRIIEHTAFVRMATRTDINAAQQHGVAFAYNGPSIRGEIMGIAGNYQISPDRFRERGYSAYLEYALSTTAAVGVSSLVTHAKEDYLLLTSNTRQAHGLFLRYSPIEPIVVMAEGDYLVQAPSGIPKATGHATLLQLDTEPVQGVHLIATGETYDGGMPGEQTSYAGWLSAAWFFLPHADVRVDGIREELSTGGGKLGMTAVLGQLHFFL